MTVRVGSSWSQPRQVNAGAPQGSVLGSFLFNVGIDTIEDGCLYPNEQFHDTMEAHANPTDYPAPSTSKRVREAPAEPCSSPVCINEETSQHVKILPTAVNTRTWLRQPKEQTWRDWDPEDLKYIDDGVNVPVVNMKSMFLYTDAHGKPIETVHPVRAEKILHHIMERAGDHGMMVNGSKTSLTCVTAATSYKASAEISDKSGQKIKSGDKMKLLGVTIDSNCTINSHVTDVVKRIRARSCTLNALWWSGFSEEDFIKVYCLYIRPLAENATESWGTVISQEQSDKIERQQNQALKNIYGFGISAARMRQMARLKTLSERREDALTKFALKNLNSVRFGKWFPEQPPQTRGRQQNRRKYEEPIIRTERYWNSLLNAMRWCLNEIA